MGSPSFGPAVAAPGASCRLKPSPTAHALRLDALQVRDGASLQGLLDQLPEPPWDVEVQADDVHLRETLLAADFVPYCSGTLFARRAEGLVVPRTPGIEIVAYDNGWADAFTVAEQKAMEGLSSLRELGSPSGYEWGAGQGSFRIARTQTGEMVGFAHADLPDGMIDWCGVIPEFRTKGIGRQLIGAVADDVKAQRGTHLLAFAEDGTNAAAFLTRLGFQAKGKKILMIARRHDTPGTIQGT